LIIYWETFTWEAFATLLTGVSAVGGAVWVGLKQTAISHRQTEILARQARIEELGLRSELFERRFAVYEATRRFLSEIVANDGRCSIETEQAFEIALNESNFLFCDDVQARLKTMWKTANAFFRSKIAMKNAYDRTGSYPQDVAEREHAQLTEISEAALDLPKLFGDELSLS
jgi:hypothetical protein